MWGWVSQWFGRRWLTWGRAGWRLAVCMPSEAWRGTNFSWSAGTMHGGSAGTGALLTTPWRWRRQRAGQAGTITTKNQRYISQAPMTMQLINSSHCKLVHDLKAFLKAGFRLTSKFQKIPESSWLARNQKETYDDDAHYAQYTLATRGSGQMKPASH